MLYEIPDNSICQYSMKNEEKVSRRVIYISQSNGSHEQVNDVCKGENVRIKNSQVAEW